MFYPKVKVRARLLPAKLSCILVLFCLQIQANVVSQQPRLSLKLDNVSVQQLFVEIERMTNLAFVYNTKDVESVTDTPELRMKSLHFTPEPTSTGASTLLLMEPFSRMDAPRSVA